MELYLDTETILASIDDEDILKYCYKHHLIDVPLNESGVPVYPQLNEHKEIKSALDYHISYDTSIDIDEEEALEGLTDTDIRQFVFENELIDISDFIDPLTEYDESELILFIQDIIKQRNRTCYDKNDLKNIINDMIDDWIN